MNFYEDLKLISEEVESRRVGIFDVIRTEIDMVRGEMKEAAKLGVREIQISCDKEGNAREYNLSECGVLTMLYVFESEGFLIKLSPKLNYKGTLIKHYIISW